MLNDPTAAAQAAIEFTRSLLAEWQLPVLSSSAAVAGVAREKPAQLRVYAPQPSVAFSRRESLMPAFDAAVAAAAAHNFAPVIRLGGGRAVAYDQNCLVIDLITANDPAASNERVFDVAAESIRRVLADLGVDARVGEIPGEFCAGAHSINARGSVKLVGIAQRVTRGARLITASLAVRNGSALGAVVSDVYSAMELGWDARTFGTLATEGVSLSLAQIADSVQHGLAVTHVEWAGRSGTKPGARDIDTVTASPERSA